MYIFKEMRPQGWVTLNLFNLQGAYDKFPDFFRMGTFIDSTHMKL